MFRFFPNKQHGGHDTKNNTKTKTKILKCAYIQNYRNLRFKNGPTALNTARIARTNDVFMEMILILSSLLSDDDVTEICSKREKNVQFFCRMTPQTTACEGILVVFSLGRT